MNEETLGRQLQAIFDERDVPETGHRLRTSRCPSTSRLAVLLEDSDAANAEERSHVASCAFCQRMIALHQREKRQEEAKSHILTALLLMKAIQLRNRRSFAAASPSTTPPLDVTTRSADGSVKATLIEDADELILAVYSDRPALNQQLLRYSFARDDEVETAAGFLVLAPEREDLFAAHTKLDAQTLYEKSEGRPQQVTVHPVEATLLGPDDREDLLEAVRKAPDSHRAAWRAWLHQASEQESLLPSAVRQMLHEAEGILNG